ncbi:MAG: hypothetical protein LBH16_02170 [Treponema sp.]|jgi:hypothetical protein|nr:hypothetical protein [Treponema sp.]
MNNLKKIAIILVLITGVSAYSFGDILYNMTIGVFRSYEEFKDDDYLRDLNGISFNTGLNIYPGESPLGLYFLSSFGSVNSAYEWLENNMEMADFYSAEEIKLSIGPSIKLNPKGKIFFPVSAGAVFSNYREEYYDYYSENTDSNSSFYEAITLGLFGDIGLIVNPSKHFTFNSGISFAWNFLRSERGRIQSDSRNTFNREFTNAGYSSFTITLYTGIGMRFNNPGEKRADREKRKNN